MGKADIIVDWVFNTGWGKQQTVQNLTGSPGKQGIISGFDKFSHVTWDLEGFMHAKESALFKRDLKVS